MSSDPAKRPLYRAATASFDSEDPGRALTTLLALTCELTGSPRAALFELDEAEAGFSPRLANGAPVSNLGRISLTTDHPVLKDVLSKRRGGTTDGRRGSLGLPLAPGTVACAPCLSAGKTVGLLFVAVDDGQGYDPEALQTLEVLADRAGDMLSVARQTAAQSYLLTKLTLLYQATHAITSTRDRQEAVRQTASHLLRATNADLCEFQVLDDGEGLTTRFRHQLGKGVQPSLVALISERGPDYPVNRQVLQELKPATICLSPPLGTGRDQELLRTEGFESATILPLSARNQALGIVRLLYNQAGRRINEQELELAQAITNVGAVGLQDAIHLETADARSTQLQTLAEIGREMTSTLELEAALENAMRHAQRLLQVEACVLFLLDEQGRELVLKASGGAQPRIRGVAIHLEEGIAGWVARSRQPLIVNDVRSNPLYHSAIDGQTGLLTTSVLCVPLETRGEVLGVIEAINHPHGAFTESDQQVLSSVASWAGIAVDNANLFRRVAEERSRLETTLVETADAVVLTDRMGNTILVNKAAGQAFRINPELATGRPALEIFHGHPLGDLLTRDDVSLPTTMEISTPTDRILYVTISEVTDIGRVAVMQDITALKQIDRMRSQLLGTAAHDLKNPLNAIRLGADLLHDAPLSDQQRKALTMMQRATDSMTNLITGLLETIRVESTSNIALEPVQINDLIRHSIEDLRIIAEKRRQAIAYAPPGESLLIMGDPNRLNSVMSNLLSNAIKFTPVGGKIHVDARWDDEEVVVSVSDNGPGIPAEEIPRVFEHLFRGRAALQDPSNPVEGTGLGLALAKTVIEQHGGRIWVTSVEGEGSTFYFSLPREPTPKTGSLRKE
jgi:signal transduction histidine kinase